MIYIDLSVTNLDEICEFYVDGLGLFTAQLNTRLICNSGPQLILDLSQPGTERHDQNFNSKRLMPCSFRLQYEDEIDELPILSQLRKMNIPYDEVANLGGHCVTVFDPSGNRVSISSRLGVFK